MDSPVIHWFRGDLRLADNPALAAAVQSGQPLVCLYILDAAAAGVWAPGGASRWWLHHSLAALRAELLSHGVTLLLAQGDTLTLLRQQCKRLGATALYWNQLHEPWARELDNHVHEQLGEVLELEPRAAQLLFDPRSIRNRQGRPFKVYTPFWKHLATEPPPREPIAAPTNWRPLRTPELDRLEDWPLLPTRTPWAARFPDRWQPGEAAAHEALEQFVTAAMASYSRQRDIPALRGTSRLSPHLNHGEISAAQVWHAVQFAAASRASDSNGATTFLRELVWREFSYHLLHHWPDLPTTPFRRQFDHFPWQPDPALLQAWQQGRTGYPLVDAGMRELYATGWMHNRVRMVAASFLVKHLLQPWQDGERWFWDTLVDANLANNAASWQWVAGSGADAAPYFRIFNPVLQGKKFDPEGQYVRRWVPELASVPVRYIHEPWRLPDGLPSDYPAPVVEHAQARQDALAAYASCKALLMPFGQ